MKASITTLTGIIILASSTAVLAQTNNELPSPPQQQQLDAANAQASQWAASNTANIGKMRAQVYDELVQAQHDGQIAYLNRTVYAHH
jgi:hypothetical protein